MWDGERILGKGMFSLVAHPTFSRQLVDGDMEQELRSFTNRDGYMFQHNNTGWGEDPG
jgi:hypothetical protein